MCCNKPMKKQNERWAPIYGYDGEYLVSDLGRVKSIFRRINHRWGSVMREGMDLHPRNNQQGYLKVAINHNGAIKQAFVHRLVLLAFVGPPPLGKNDAAHLNGDPSDNRLSNLKWMSRRENCLHKRVHGVLPVPIHDKKGRIIGCVVTGKSVIGKRNYHGKQNAPR